MLKRDVLPFLYKKAKLFLEDDETIEGIINDILGSKIRFCFREDNKYYINYFPFNEIKKIEEI